MVTLQGHSAGFGKDFAVWAKKGFIGSIELFGWDKYMKNAKHLQIPSILEHDIYVSIRDQFGQQVSYDLRVSLLKELSHVLDRSLLYPLIYCLEDRLMEENIW